MRDWDSGVYVWAPGPLPELHRLDPMVLAVLVGMMPVLTIGAVAWAVLAGRVYGAVLSAWRKNRDGA